jgi:hypothetical protein
MRGELSTTTAAMKLDLVAEYGRGSMSLYGILYEF